MTMKTYMSTYQWVNNYVDLSMGYELFDLLEVLTHLKDPSDPRLSNLSAYMPKRDLQI